MKYFYSTILLSLIFNSNTLAQESRITGNIDGLDGKIYLLMDEYPMDSTVVSGGLFEFVQEIDEPYFAQIRQDGQNIVSFFVEAGDISITGNIQEQNATATGTPANENYKEYLDFRRKLIDEISNETDTDEYFKKLDLLLTAENVHIRENHDNIFGLFLFVRHLAWNLDEHHIYEQLESFDVSLQNHRYAKEARIIALSKTVVFTGELYVPFSLPGPDGSSLAISDYLNKGKFILLEFWATWCGPCVMEMPYLRHMYSQFREKGLEIFSVSVNSDEKYWKDCIDKLGMEWVNVNTDKGWRCPVLRQYKVAAIPSSFLISPDGHIIATDLRGEELFDKLSEVLNY